MSTSAAAIGAHSSVSGTPTIASTIRIARAMKQSTGRTRIGVSTIGIGILSHNQVRGNVPGIAQEA